MGGHSEMPVVSFQRSGMSGLTITNLIINIIKYQIVCNVPTEIKGWSGEKTLYLGAVFNPLQNDGEVGSVFRLMLPALSHNPIAVRIAR